MAITRIKAETALSGTIPSTNISQSSMANVSTGTSWQAVKTTSFTAVSGEGYFVDTTSGTITITLPSSPSVGDTIEIRDYAGTFGSNNVTLDVNGLKLAGTASNGVINTNDSMVTLVYSGTDKGWLSVENEAKTNLVPPVFTSATGGTVTESGDYKIHTFTGDGCFVVSQIGNSPTVPTGGPATVDYLVVAGGASGGGDRGGGGGAGGFRESKDSTVSSPHTASPLAATTGLTVTTSTYPITVGGGGTSATCQGNSGSNSVFSTITSSGGGGGASGPPAGTFAPLAGGSGGGNRAGYTPNAIGPVGANGNTPPVSPPQGNRGGAGYDGISVNTQGGGGGGAGAVGGNAGPNQGGAGGNGVTTTISGSPTSYSGGGGGGTDGGNGGFQAGGGNGGSGGTGGGGAGNPNGPDSGPVAPSGTANTGGGGGGGSTACGQNSGAGGSGIVIIRYKFQ